MKGIILAGGSGNRLFPTTRIMSKQLLPIYDKPMIYYPLSTLMLSGIKEILIISTPQDLPQFKKLLGEGEAWGISLSYAQQTNPEGLAQAFIIGADFIDGNPCCLILGDNVFYGQDISKLFQTALQNNEGATIFAHHVEDPERYGVVSFDEMGRATNIVEKPQNTNSKWAVVGLYIYDNQVVDIARTLKPSPRGELEITDLNMHYLKNGNMKAEKLGRGFAWFDAGTHESLYDAGAFVQSLEKRQGLKISCPEEIAFRQGWIDEALLIKAIAQMGKCNYAKYLNSLLEDQ